MALTIPRRTGRETVGRYGFFEVERHDLEVDGGHHPPAYVLRFFDWAAAVAVTADGRFVLVRQHRYGIDAVTVEPAGGMIDPGEDPAAAALRELREETGYAGGAAEPLGVVHPNPAMQDNRYHMFLVRGAARVGAPELDHLESAEPLLMTRDEVVAAIGDGRISHALAVLSLERALARL